MDKVKIFFIRFLVAILAFQGTVATQLINVNGARAAGEPVVVINEIMWMGSTASAADEWIELRNNTDQVINLTGWWLTNAASSGGALTISAGVVAARGFFLISHFAETSASSILDIAPDLVDNDIVLSNTCAPIELIKPGEEEEDEETVVDSMGCNGSKYFEGLNDTVTPLKKSMERQLILVDGTQASSWQTSAGFVNLDAPAAPSNFATPKKLNDDSKPLEDVGLVNDGQDEDKDFTAIKTGYPVSWSGFSDPESGIANYQLQIIRLGPVSAEVSKVIIVTDPLVKSYTFLANQFTASPEAELGGLQEGMKYEARVRATNGVGITGAWEDSDDIVVDTVNPAPPTMVVVSDVANDNGGSLKASWKASTSVDEITYQLNYRRVGDSTWTPVDISPTLEKTISGLQNAPTSYEFTVEAIDFNSQRSAPSAVVTGQALVNLVPINPVPINPVPIVLVPIIEASKIVVSQNKPGLDDTVAGQAGATNKPKVVVTLLSALPGNPASTVIGSVMSNADGSFAAIGIGDNKYDQVWLQLTDTSNNLSLPLKLSNDIVGPAAPVLNNAASKCQSDTCRVSLDWQAGSIDTTSYKVVFSVDGVDQQTFEVTATSMAMDQPTGKSYLFKVIGFDQYGNPSLPSNVFSIALTNGVKTTVGPAGGQPVTTTEAISGSRAIRSTTVPPSPAAPAQFVPKVKAAELVVESPSASTPPLVADAENSRDWVRILVVVVLLLVIAGSFYALSRSVQETPEEEFDRNKAESKDKTIPAATKRRRKRRRHKKT